MILDMVVGAGFSHFPTPPTENKKNNKERENPVSADSVGENTLLIPVVRGE